MEKRKTAQKKSLFTHFRIVVSVIVIFCTTLSCLAPYVNPEKFWVIALFGLAFIYTYLCNAVFLIINFFRRRKILFAHLALFIAGMPVFLNHFSFGRVGNGDDGINVKLMSYNVRVFDLYNWSKNLETKANMFELIKKESPQIISFQEFYSSTTADYRNLDSLKQLLGLKEVHTLFPVFLYGTDYYGVVTMTSFPVLRRETIFHNKAQSNGAICTDIVVNNDTIRVYNVHLQSIRFKPEDYKFIKSIEISANEKQLQGLEGVIERLRNAFVVRASQVNLLSEHIKQSPFPVVVSGDFNDTPASYTYRKLSQSLKDAFKESGSGVSTTYNGTFPAFRIDYILHSRDIASTNYKVIRKNYSDHYPLVVKLKIDKSVVE